MDLSARRASPLAWVFAAAALVAAALVVILHWSPAVQDLRPGVEMAVLVILGFSVLAGGLLELRRLHKLDVLDR